MGPESRSCLCTVVGDQGKDNSADSTSVNCRKNALGADPGTKAQSVIVALDLLLASLLFLHLSCCLQLLVLSEAL